MNIDKNDPSSSWEKSQNILVILAHPDDPEFFCGATLARWALAGHLINYVLLTNGNKGGGSNISPETLCEIRRKEQQNAAAVIGVQSVKILHHEDGYLIPSMELRSEIVRLIRQEKPDILVTCDPTLLYSWNNRVNHPDHRAAGQAVLDAVFPAAGNSHFFPDLITQEGLLPHTPREVWVSLAVQPSVILDVSSTWEIKINALKMHKSQIGDPLLFEKRMRARHTEDSSDDLPRYEEKFRVLNFA